MDLDTFLSELRSGPLAPHEDWMRRQLRPALDVRVAAPGARVRSRLGGAPELPVGAEWPRIDARPYRFVAQLELAELPSRALWPLPWRDALPSAGLLSLFVADDPTGELDPRAELDWTDPRYAIAILTPPGIACEPLATPPEVDFGASALVTFHDTLDLPGGLEQAQGWPFDCLRDDARSEAYDALRARMHGEHHLFGYPTQYTLAYDPTPPGRIPLASFTSSELHAWTWHDGDALMLFLDPKEVREGRFGLGADCG